MKDNLIPITSNDFESRIHPFKYDENLKEFSLVSWIEKPVYKSLRFFVTTNNLELIESFLRIFSKEPRITSQIISLRKKNNRFFTTLFNSTEFGVILRNKIEIRLGGEE